MAGVQPRAVHLLALAYLMGVAGRLLGGVALKRGLGAPGRAGLGLRRWGRGRGSLQFLFGSL